MTEDGDGSAAPADPIARIIFALVVLACFAAFIITQRLKHTPTAVTNFELGPTFDPRAAPPGNLEAISFKLTSADDVTVTIEGTGGETVATLVQGYPAPRYKQFSLRWNGRRGTAAHVLVQRLPDGHAIHLPVNRGPIAPAGEYRVIVHLARQDKTVPAPRTFTLVGP